MTTRSTGRPERLAFLNVSRIKRLARFLTTAPPSFLDATMPRRVAVALLGAAMIVRNRPCDRRPLSNTRWNSLRRRNFRSAGRSCAAMDASLSGRRDRQPFASLGAPPLEHGAAVLGGHTDEKPVRALAAPAVWLKRAFALHEIPAAVYELRRNPHTSEGRLPVSISRARAAVFYPVPRLCYSPFPAWTVGSPPEVFHNCGKHCGKAR